MDIPGGGAYWQGELPDAGACCAKCLAAARFDTPCRVFTFDADGWRVVAPAAGGGGGWCQLKMDQDHDGRNGQREPHASMVAADLWVVRRDPQQVGDL